MNSAPVPGPPLRAALFVERLERLVKPVSLPDLERLLAQAEASR